MCIINSFRESELECAFKVWFYPLCTYLFFFLFFNISFTKNAIPKNVDGWELPAKKDWKTHFTFFQKKKKICFMNKYFGPKLNRKSKNSWWITWEYREIYSKVLEWWMRAVFSGFLNPLSFFLCLRSKSIFQIKWLAMQFSSWYFFSVSWMVFCGFPFGYRELFPCQICQLKKKKKIDVIRLRWKQTVICND